MVIHRYIGIMTAALLLASCNQDDDAAMPQGADEARQPLTVSTRAADDETFDSFRLYLHDLATNTVTEEHILTRDGETGAWLENGTYPVTDLLPAVVNAAVCDDPGQITFENYLDAPETTTVTCRIPADQTDADKLAEAGKRMFAVSRLDKGQTLYLSFQHACAKMLFIVNDAAVTNAGGKGKLTGINLAAHSEYVYHCEGEGAGNYYTWNEDDKCDVACFLAEADTGYDNKPTVTACVGYNKYKAGDILMTLSVDGIARNVPINADLTVEPGNVYTFTLDITPKEVTATVVSNEGNDIPGWEESNETEL